MAVTCTCHKLQSCAVCRLSCECDVDGLCKACEAKPNPSDEWLRAQYGIPPKVKPAEFCEDCKTPIAVAGYGCQECCDHEPDADEGYHCLNCGKDCSEDAMADAYDRAKDARKYRDVP